MAPIAPDTIYTKTAKGVLEVKNKSVKLSRELGLVFLSIDGKASVADLQPRSGMTPAQFQHALHALVTDGYIKNVSHPARESGEAGGLDFTQKQAIASVNAEAASRALAAADATKRAQTQAKAALEARLRQEAEARARALAEARAESEAQARMKAEEAARAASAERSQAEAEAGAASDAVARAQAEARARTAAAAAMRAEAEARVRGEAEERARALAETKRAAEEEAASEAQSSAQAEAQAQARASAEGRAREVLEAQLAAMQGVAAYAGNPDAQAAEAARTRVRELENEAERAREAAREVAQAEGRANEVPAPEMDIAERVRQLNARVAAARTEREDASRREMPAVDFTPGQSKPATDTWPALQLGAAATGAKPPDDLPMVSIPSPDEPVQAQEPESASDLPVVDLDRAQTIAHPTPEHVPTALERAMAELAARAQARSRQDEAAKAHPDDSPRAPEEPPAPAAEPQPEPATKVAPTIDDEDPIAERLNIDRASHDIIAETVAARRSAETAQFTHDASEARRRRAEEQARRAAAAEREKRRKKLFWGLAIAAVTLPVIVAAWLQFATLNGYIPAAQQALSQRLNQPVAIGSLRYILLPTPRIVLEDLWIGKGQGVKVRRVMAPVHPFAAFAGPRSFDTVHAQGVEIDAEILTTIPKWTGGRPADALHVENLRVSELKMNLPGADLGALEGNIVFAANGTVQEATFSTDKATLTLTPRPEGVRVALDATGWRIPYGPPVDFDRLRLNGLIDQGQIAAGEFTGTLASGSVEGALNARWAGPISLQGEFKLQNVRVLDLTRALTPNFSARGTLKANGRFSMQGADWGAMTMKPQVESTFSIARGELTNIDLQRAVQSAAPGAIRGGKTSFDDLSGVMQVAGGHYGFRQLQLNSGALNASGAVDVNAQGQLNGRFNAQIASRGSVVARSALGVSGTVQDPQLGR